MLPRILLITVILVLGIITISQHVHIEITAIKRDLHQTTFPLVASSIRSVTARTSTVTTHNQTVSVDTINTTEISISYNTINPHPYKYIRIPSGVCTSTGNRVDPHLLILVKSNIFQFGHRMAIRMTWGKFSDSSIQLAFLLGYSPLVTPFAKMEYELHKDIIQENFLDEYKNNTLKTIMGFNWVTTYCNQSKFILFVDDDYFVNVPNVRDFVNNITTNQSTFIGYKYEKARPRRKQDSKWYVSKEEYPDDYWPPYISGGSMLISMDVIINMTKTFPYVKQLYIDDVYLGIVAYLLNITLSHDRRFETKYVPGQLRTLFSSHEYGSPHNLVHQWSEIDDET